MRRFVGLLLLSAMSVGCGTFIRSSDGARPRKHSHPRGYDEPFGTSPDYGPPAGNAEGERGSERPSGEQDRGAGGP